MQNTWNSSPLLYFFLSNPFLHLTQTWVALTTVERDVWVACISSSKQNVRKHPYTKFQLKKKIAIIILNYGGLSELSGHILDSFRVLISINAALEAQAVQNEWCVLVSIIISLVPYWLYQFGSSLFIFLSSLGVAYVSSPCPQVVCCGVIQFGWVTLVCSDRPEDGNPLPTNLTNVPQLPAGDTDSRLGTTFQILVLCQDS